MTTFIWLYAIFCCCLLHAQPLLQVTVRDPLSLTSSSTWQENTVNNTEKTHLNLLTNKKSLKIKSLPKEVTFIANKVTIAGQTITRSIPIIDGLPTEGVDGIFSTQKDQSQFLYTKFDIPSSNFKLNAAEAVAKALAFQPLSLIKDPFVENIADIYEALWLMHGGSLRPAYKVRPPTLFILDLKDIYIDGETGDVLSIEDVAQMFNNAPANLFVYAPTSANLKASLKPVTLGNLAQVKENGFLVGQYINVKNCCKYYTCPTEEPCSDSEKRCAHKSHKNALQSRETLDLPTDSLGLNPLMSLPRTISVDTVRCTYLPFAKAHFKNGSDGPLGFFETPIDNDKPESETDKFSEVQAYFSISTFFSHIRELLEDQTFCLRKEAMSCNPDGSPVVDGEGNPVNPYKVFVNQMVPDTKISGPSSEDSDSFIAQVHEGKGSKDNPIVLNQFARLGNAAFIPALSTLKKNTPRADEYLSDLIKPYDHNVFFQGVKDFAYDGDVVFHEFMHAVTTSLVGKLNTLGLDSWGIHAQPGSLNEGWSDYFSASMANKSMIGAYASTKDGFGEASLRNIDNNASCPNDVIGENHNDSLIWSGALWEIRRSIIENNLADPIEFDRAVLTSLARAITSEDFKSQSEKLISAINARPTLGKKVSDIAAAVFERRHISDCFRAFTLSSVDKNNQVQTRIKNLLLVPSKNQIGLKNYAPAPLQLEAGIPASATSLTLSWRQYIPGNGAMLGTQATPHTTKNIEPLSLLYNVDIPIHWKFIGTAAIATAHDITIPQMPIKARYEQGYWHATIPLNFADCEQKTLYISLLSNDYKYVLENIHISFDLDTTKDISQCDFSGSQRLTQTDSKMSCSTTAASQSLWIFMIAFIMLKRRVARRL